MHKRPKLPALGTPSSGGQAAQGGSSLPHLGGGASASEGDAEAGRSAHSRSRAQPPSPLSPQRPFEEDGRRGHRSGAGTPSTSSFAAGSSEPHDARASPASSSSYAGSNISSLRQPLQPGGQALPSLSDRSTGAPSVPPSAPTSTHSSRRSSSSSRGFDQGHPAGPSCPAPPPEVAGPLSGLGGTEPARSRRVAGSGSNAVYEVVGGALSRGRSDVGRQGHHTAEDYRRAKSELDIVPSSSSRASAGGSGAARQRSRSSAGTPSGTATPERAQSGSRTPTGTRGPRLGALTWSGGALAGLVGAEASSASNASPPSAEKASASMPLTRAGWSGSLQGDEEAASSAGAAGSATPSKGSRRDEVMSYHLPSPPSCSSPAGGRRQRPAGLAVRQSEGERTKESAGRTAETTMTMSLPDTSATFCGEAPSSPSRARVQKSFTVPISSSSGAGGTPTTAKHGVTSTSSSREALPPPSPTSSQASAGSSTGGQRTLGKSSRKLNVNPRASLTKGSRDDSFLSTISESTRSSDSTSTEDRLQRDSKLTVLDGSQIEVFSEFQGDGRMHMDVVKDFRELFVREGEKFAEQMHELLRSHGFDKPLEMQRRVIPLVMSAFSDEAKSFITVQGGPQCGKTFALVLGILGALGAAEPGIRVVVLSTTGHRDFKRYVDICSVLHPLRLECFECTQRKVSFEGLPLDPDSAVAGFDPLEDLQRIASAQASGHPVMVFGHPSRVLPLLREAPSWSVDLGNVQVLVLDDAEETICMGLMDEVCEVTTILRHFSHNRLRHILLSHFLSHEAKSMIRCLRNSLLRQQNLFGIRAHRTQARAKSARHYYAVAPRARWPSMLAVLHHALALPSGIIFDDASSEARAQAKASLRALGVTASVWNALQEQGSGARAAARDAAAAARRGPAFHLMPSDLVVLKVDLPQVRCVLHFEVPRRELSVYGLRLMCLEQQESKKAGSRKQNSIQDGRGLSVLFVEEEDVVRDLEKTFHIKMQEVPTEMLRAG
eukprot:TRINITY_DN11463_c0_g2_i2.p1 TRINITY_DN11463_c0_g2~~TRINITY_DN11463_c0_g2_i2.p1  ORF type:complete len:1026 (+),score=169.99 TRINITY_DN11463_c0_g2_i2:70-3078(+)